VLRRPPGRYDLEVRQLRGGRVIWSAFAHAARLLPPGARRAAAAHRSDRALASRLAGLGRAFEGYAGFWVHDLGTGRTAGWNADARFPAASTVKLGVLVETLRRFDPRREDVGVDYDLRALAGWSSNLAANRLAARVGGPRAVEAALARLGARSSTYTGDYRVGTSVAVDAPRQPPSVSSRVTTARDLGRILFTIQAGALGNGPALRRLGFDRGRARYALGLLVASEPSGNNVGLLRPALGPGVPIAQKNGWTRSIRHTAAIVYGERGPTIVVVLTYREGLSLAEAVALGRRVVALVAP
jgi:beta-lactamase class A